MNRNEWNKTNKKCQRERCKHSLYRRNFSSVMYTQGDLICPVHGDRYKILEG